MNFSPELVAAIGAALVALITAINSAATKRGQRQVEQMQALVAENTQLRIDKDDLRTALRAADRWSGQLLRVIDRAGLDAPPAPDLTGGDDDNDPAPGQAPPLGQSGVPAARGRRRRVDPDGG